MKIRCVKEDLLRGIQIVQKGISTKSSLPILSSILFEADDKLKLQTTDLETSISCLVNAKVTKKGKLGIPARLIGDIVRSLPEAAVDLEYKAEKAELALICENSSFEIKTLSADDFPKVPNLEGSPQKRECVLGSAMFMNVVKQVIRAASKDETRPILTGILFTLGENMVRMVATDSYRLAVTESKIIEEEEKKEKEVEEKINAVIPTRALEDVVKIMSILESQEVGMRVLENHIVFNLGEAQLISRLIEGQYPNYRQLLPDSYQLELPVKREELVGAVKRISLMAQNNSPVQFHLGKNNLTVSAVTQEVGEAKEDVKIKYEGEEVKIAFNGQYLLDGLTAVSEEDVLIKLLDPLKPGLIQPAKSEEFLYLIMPVRLS